MNAKIDTYEGTPHLVATDGYVLVAIKLDDEASELLGTMIRRSAIEKWYKLANGKSRLTSEELVSVSRGDYADNGSYQTGDYPEWTRLIPKEYRNPVGKIAFNATYMNTLQEVDGSDGMEWSIGGALEPVMAKNERGVYIFMPRKV